MSLPAGDGSNHTPRNDDPVGDYSNKSDLLPPRLLELQKLANATRATEHLHEEHEHSTRRVRRRLEPGIIQDIARNYEAGATTPALCAEFGLSKTNVLRLLPSPRSPHTSTPATTTSANDSSRQESACDLEVEVTKEDLVHHLSESAQIAENHNAMSSSTRTWWRRRGNSTLTFTESNTSNVIWMSRASEAANT